MATSPFEKGGPGGFKSANRWLAPDHRYFKILGDDEATYIIRHGSATGQWELVFYQAAGIASPKLSVSN